MLKTVRIIYYFSLFLPIKVLTFLKYRYCQCFAAQITCTPSCKCLSCANTDAYKSLREGSIKCILERNPNAFDSKFKQVFFITFVNIFSISKFKFYINSTRLPFKKFQELR